MKFHKQVKKARSSRPGMFSKNDILKNSAKFTEKHLCWSLDLGLKLY